MMGARLSKLMTWVALILVAAGFLVIQVWKQNQYITLIKNNRELHRQVKKLKSDIASMELERENLMSFSRLEKVGQERFGFVYPDVPEFVYPEKQSEIQTASQPWDNVVSWIQKVKIP